MCPVAGGASSSFFDVIICKKLKRIQKKVVPLRS